MRTLVAASLNPVRGQKMQTGAACLNRVRGQDMKAAVVGLSRVLLRVRKAISFETTRASHMKTSRPASSTPVR